MVMKKKGQVALEWIMTYGWAILSAIIVIGALGSYFYFNSGYTIYKEECVEEENLLVLFSNDRLAEKGITLDDLKYVVYAQERSLLVASLLIGGKGNGDSWLFELEKTCKEVPVMGLDIQVPTEDDGTYKEHCGYRATDGVFVCTEVIMNYKLKKDWLDTNCQCLYDGKCPTGYTDSFPEDDSKTVCNAPYKDTYCQSYSCDGDFIVRNRFL